MSKQSKKRAKKRRKHRDKLHFELLCPGCQAVDDGTPQALLQALTDTMNLCEDSRLELGVRHNMIRTSVGYIVRLPDHRWGARTTSFERFPQPLSSVPGDDLDDQ